jgi:hypothetical protein
MLNITSCTVTNDPNNLLYYSILSIVNIVDQILIYDDANYYFDYSIFDKYENVKIFNDKSLENLGQKKQLLVDNSKNDIVMRWDDDFILYSEDVLNDCYNKLLNTKLDGVITQNFNIVFTTDYLYKLHPYCTELYIYKKSIIKFQKAHGYPDYPCYTIKDPKISNYKKCLFLHFSNFKSCEKLACRPYMCKFEAQNSYKNLFEWVQSEKNRIYTFENVIALKKTILMQTEKKMYSLDKYIKTDDINLNNITPELRHYISKKYNIEIIGNKIKFRTQLTDMYTNLFYWGGNYKKGNFGDLLSWVIFEKLTGIKPVFYDCCKQNNDIHYMSIGSIINYSNDKSIIWGTGTITKKINKINFHKVFCVRGPKTREALLKHYNDIPEKYGDPALLMPLLYKSKNIKKYNIGIIPHTVDYNELKQKFNGTNIHVINLYINNDEDSIKKVIDDINKCKFIFSSSLHGIILSNAYDIPVIKFRHNKLAGDDIKFIDYFESVYSNKYYCNTNFDIDYCINNFKVVRTYYTKPTLIKERQKDLIETCPFFDKTLMHLLFNN